MTEAFQNLMIGLIEIALALIYFQKALPVMLTEARIMAVKIWLFAFALGLFGTGRLESAIRLEHTAGLYDLGHVALILYAFLRLRLIIMQSGKCKWWHRP